MMDPAVVESTQNSRLLLGMNLPSKGFDTGIIDGNAPLLHFIDQFHRNIQMVFPR
jgi:hypothetical protein